MQVIIRPKKLSGIIDAIPSKSYLHRAIICASLAEGESTINNVIYSNDILNTIEACEAIGAEIIQDSNKLVITGAKVSRTISDINVGESASTLRFLIPVLLLNSSPFTIDGDESIVKRPLDPYFDLFDEMGISYSNKCLPITFKGELKPGTYNIKGSVSSQFISGLLFALPLLNGDSIINITDSLESKSYVDMTIAVLNKFGINIVNENYQKFYICGNQKYMPATYSVEGDYSQAAFFLVANALGSKIGVNGLNKASIQGDKKILEIIINKETNIDLKDIPDLGPILSVLASFSEKAIIKNAGRLRLKESDRIESIKNELGSLGAKIEVVGDDIYFEGVKEFKPSRELSACNDHRIAMSLAIASTVSNKPLVINGFEAINKSYPTFLDDFKKLGGDFDVKY